MKKIFLLLLVILVSVFLFAQTPNQFKYQAVLRNTDGTIMAEESVSVIISILKSDLTTSVFEETHTTSTNKQGLINLNIGSIEDLSTVNWTLDENYMEISVNGTIIGTSQLLSVPYAMHSKTAETLTGTNTETDPVYASSQAANITATDITKLGNLSGVNTGDQDGSETKVTAGTNITVTGAGTTASPYVVNTTAGDSGFTHYIGELYGGGIIVSVWKTEGVEHGLIAALTDQSTALIWTTAAYQSTIVPGDATSPTDGLSNSNAIVAQAGAGTTYAAGLCRAYSATGDGGLYDWYLPSNWELNQCYNAAFVINTILGATNGFQFDYSYYWSSTESNFINAWSLYFPSNFLSDSNKSNTYRVRAVRRY